MEIKIEKARKQEIVVIVKWERNVQDGSWEKTDIPKTPNVTKDFIKCHEQEWSSCRNYIQTLPWFRKPTNAGRQNSCKLNLISTAFAKHWKFSKGRTSWLRRSSFETMLNQNIKPHNSENPNWDTIKILPGHEYMLLPCSEPNEKLARIKVMTHTCMSIMSPN